MGESQTVRMPSGRVERCTKPGNCRKHDPYRNQAATAAAAFVQDARAAQQAAPHLREGKTFPPLVVPVNPLWAPSKNIDHEALDYEYDWGTHDMPSYSEDPEPSFADMNRDSAIENLKITEANLDQVLPALFGANREDIPKDLYQYAHEIGVDDPDNWDIEVTGGYYGDELGKAYLNRKQLEQLTNWYYQQGNARDEAGILAYCRSKGLVTAGMTPLEAIKAQLAQENPGISHAAVDQAREVYVETLPHAQVKAGSAPRLAAVEARAAQVPVAAENTHTPRITGVAAKVDGRYRLIDGYHRYKDAIESTRQSGKYIILD